MTNNYVRHEKSGYGNLLKLFLKSCLSIVIYFVAVFYVCFFVSGIIIFFSLLFFEIQNIELFMETIGLIVTIILGGLDFYLSFKGRWSPVSFLFSIPIFAGMLLKAIFNNTKKIQFDVAPPQIYKVLKEIPLILYKFWFFYFLSFQTGSNMHHPFWVLFKTAPPMRAVSLLFRYCFVIECCNTQAAIIRCRSFLSTSFL